MKNAFIILIATLIAGNVWAQRAPVCTPNNSASLEFCQRMRHLRSTTSLIDSQRVLMRLDYDFLSALSLNLANNAQTLEQIAPPVLESHKVVLKKINEMATQMNQLSNAKNPFALVIANNLNSQCLNCHSSSTPETRIIWNDMFSFNWEQISKDCSSEGRNPYLCKSMNFMGANYNFMVSSYIAKIQEYSTLEMVAKEVVKILRNLKELNFVQLNEAHRLNAENAALEIVQLSKMHDATVFEKSRDLNNACMRCHNEVSPADLSLQKARFHSVSK